ncbi:O-methyltransferase [Serratia marcescens]|uniref:O-methyltransferase n=1 Tax=Serratia marcescens TaxID=615 RepID=UPI0034E8F0E9
MPSENSYSHEDVILHPEKYVNYGFSIYPSQGDLIYLLCRAIGAKRVIDFATSLGMSALYFAAAMKDNGGGQVFGSELVSEKAKIAMTNLEGAGLQQYVDIKVGDARRTLRTVDGPIDFALIDGWPGNDGGSLAREVMEIIRPELRVGALIMDDNGEPDFMEYTHNVVVK